jgi:hypothetical protein
MLKWVEQFQATCFDQKKKAHIENLQKFEVGQTNENFRRKKFLMNCRWVIWIIMYNVQQYMW